MLIAQSAVDATKVGVAIAIRYAAKRPQFGDKPILDYLTHQRRLMPALATAYAMHLSMLRLKALLYALDFLVDCCTRVSENLLLTLCQRLKEAGEALDQKFLPRVYMHPHGIC